jgi:kelch-like protein 10
VVIYFVNLEGGFDGTERLSDGERYNPKTHAWTALAPMKQPRSTFSLVRVEDVLYAIGGYSDKPEASVEAYDVIGDKW